MTNARIGIRSYFSCGAQLARILGESVAAGQGQGQLGVSTAITGISPFAPSNRICARASFDLNALWFSAIAAAATFP